MNATATTTRRILFAAVAAGALASVGAGVAAADDLNAKVPLHPGIGIDSPAKPGPKAPTGPDSKLDTPYLPKNLPDLGSPVDDKDGTDEVGPGQTDPDPTDPECVTPGTEPAAGTELPPCPTDPWCKKPGDKTDGSTALPPCPEPECKKPGDETKEGDVVVECPTDPECTKPGEQPPLTHTLPPCPVDPGGSSTPPSSQTPPESTENDVRIRFNTGSDHDGGYTGEVIVAGGLIITLGAGAAAGYARRNRRTH